MTLHGMPGIGGSLGCCAMCGKSFVMELLVPGERVQTIHIDGIDGDLCLHTKCLKELETIRGNGWEELPDGPLRDCYAKAAEAQA